MERRISLRSELEFPVVEKAGRKQNRARASDISATGIGLVCYEEPRHAEGCVVELELHLPHAKQPKQVKASPIWQDGHRKGLAFVELDDADRLDLAEMQDRARRRGVKAR
jgi:c-di-GMP-binding flagellar brake protein YcgR